MADVSGVLAFTPDRRLQVDQFIYPMRPLGQRVVTGNVDGQIETGPLSGQQRPWYVVQTSGKGDLHLAINGSVIHYSQTHGTAYILYGRG